MRSRLKQRENNPADRLLTVDEVAERLAVSRDVIEKHVRSGDLPAVDVSPRRGRPSHRPTWRISSEDLAQFLEKRRTQPQDDRRPTGRRRMVGKTIKFIQ